MKTDYKFHSISTRTGKTIAVVAFYEGDDNSVGTYVRSSVLRTETFEYDSEKTHADLVTLMNTELATDGTRDSIAEQI